MNQKDFLRELGLNAVVTRMKRLSDAMLHDGKRMYRELGFDIEPNWFAVFKLLKKRGALPVTEISDAIGLSHPSVISIVNKMVAAGYLKEGRSHNDNRMRILSLTAKAEQMLPRYEQVWAAGTTGYKKMVPDIDVLYLLDVLEDRIGEKGFRSRTLEELEKIDAINIIEWRQEYLKDFAALNYQWIEKFFGVEKHDREQLDDPYSYIIRPGGQIFFALLGKRAVGTVALIKIDGESYELAKMVVAEGYTGYGIGDRLMEASIEYVRREGKKRIILETNTRQFPAINMYRKWNFYDIPLDPNSQFARANVRMQIDL